MRMTLRAGAEGSDPSPQVKAAIAVIAAVYRLMSRKVPLKRPLDIDQTTVCGTIRVRMLLLMKAPL